MECLLGCDHHHFIRSHAASRDERQAMNTPDLRWQLAATGAGRHVPDPASPWQQRALLVLSSSAGAALVIALLVGLGLLLAFQQVVSGAVRQGELRRAAMAASTSIERSVLPELRRVPSFVKPMEK